jgi:hypothetical protein
MRHPSEGIRSIGMFQHPIGIVKPVSKLLLADGRLRTNGLWIELVFYLLGRWEFFAFEGEFVRSEF